MKNLFILLTSLIFFISCGGESSPPDESMELSKSYTLASGDKIVKNSDNALLKIYHVDGSKDSTVQLLEGKATIQH